MTSYELRRLRGSARDAISYEALPPPHTWAELIALEPRLARIAEAIDAGQFGTMEGGWRDIKELISPIVGWHARRALVATQAAWDLASQELRRRFEALAQCSSGGGE